ncbi:HEAT repeat domain-containing protein [Sphingobacterium siyangense]|uniref:HEAT repeat domain-containing protein n=1 Tax=Sphingobacterium siyangense TaxID=459529 RepID=UPI003DA358BA
MLSKIEHIIHFIRSFFEGEGWPILVTIALVLSFLFWISCLVGIAIFYYRDYRYRQYYAKIYPILRDFIYEHILIDNMVSHFPVDKLTFDLNKAMVQKVVRHILHEYIFTIGGEKGKSMRNLFNELGFDKEAQYEIRHAGNHVIGTVKSLADLALMQVEIQEGVLIQLMGSPRTEIRVAAFKYLLLVRGEEAFEQVFSHIQGITDLDALDIYQAIVSTDYVGTYLFSQWLDPAKPFSINSLIMDLMIYYQQLDEERLWQLIVSADDPKTVRKAINSLGKLLARNSESRLVDFYTVDQSLNVKIEIVKALGRLGQGKSIDLLVHIFKDENAVLALRKHAYRSLLAQKPYSTSILRNIETEGNTTDYKLIRYVNHPMVHYI